MERPLVINSRLDLHQYPTQQFLSFASNGQISGRLEYGGRVKETLVCVASVAETMEFWGVGDRESEDKVVHDNLQKSFSLDELSQARLAQKRWDIMEERERGVEVGRVDANRV